MIGILNTILRAKKLKLEKKYQEIFIEQQNLLYDIKLKKEEEKLRQLELKTQMLELQKEKKQTIKEGDTFFKGLYRDIVAIEQLKKSINIIFFEYDFKREFENSKTIAKEFNNEKEALLFFGKKINKRKLYDK